MQGFVLKFDLGRQYDYECVYKEGFDTQHDYTLGLDIYVTGMKEIPAHSSTPDSQCVSFLAFPKKVPISYYVLTPNILSLPIGLDSQ